MSSNTAHSGIVNMLYKSRKVLLEYLKIQEFITTDYDEYSINEVNSMVSNNQLDMLVENNDTIAPIKNKKAYIKYHLIKSLRPQYIDEFVEDLYNIDQVLKRSDTLIVVSKDEPNDSLRTHLKQLYSDEGYYIIIIFSLKRLQCNILEHSLVPEFTKLSTIEMNAMKKKYNIINNSNIPEISRFDPIALAIGLVPGEICHIKRPSKTSIYIDYYRYCINR